MGQNYEENSGEMFGSNFHILKDSFTFGVGTALAPDIFIIIRFFSKDYFPIIPSWKNFQWFCLIRNDIRGKQGKQKQKSNKAQWLLFMLRFIWTSQCFTQCCCHPQSELTSNLINLEITMSEQLQETLSMFIWTIFMNPGKIIQFS